MGWRGAAPGNGRALPGFERGQRAGNGGGGGGGCAAQVNGRAGTASAEGRAASLYAARPLFRAVYRV